MASKLNTRSHSWEGHWRLPESQDSHPGILTYSTLEGFRLSLLSEGFESPYVELDLPAKRFEGGGGIVRGLRDAIYPAVFGEAEGRFITLFDVMNIHSSRKIGAQAPSGKSTYVASSALEGAHVSSEDCAVIKSASVSIDNLHRWLGDPEELAVISQHSDDPAQKGYFVEVRTGPKLGPKRGATLPDGTAVTISRNWVLPDLRWSTNSYESQTQEFAQAKFVPPTPWTLIDVREHAWKIAGLITLALDRPCAPHAIDIVVAGVDQDHSASYITHRTTPGNSEEFVRKHEPFLFTCSDAQFEDVVPAWFSFYESHGSVLDLFTTIRNDTAGYLETSVFLSAILAEAFHKSVFGKKDSITPAARALAKEIFPEDSNPYSLFKRLLDLYCRLPKAAAQTLIPDVTAWSRQHVDARNSISHEAGLGASPQHRAWAASETTTALVMALLLSEIGVSDSTIKRALTESSTFRKAAYSAKTYLNTHTCT